MLSAVCWPAFGGRCYSMRRVGAARSVRILLSHQSRCASLIRFLWIARRCPSRPNSTLPKVSHASHGGSWVWRYQDVGYYLDVGLRVRLRVTSVLYTEPAPHTTVSDTPRLLPMQVRGSMKTPGLGALSWWMTDGDAEEPKATT